MLPLLKFFRKSPAQLYVGTLTVLPRKDFLRHFEGGFLSGAQMDHVLTERLLVIFAFPKAADLSAPKDDDVAIDVVLESYSRGGWAEVSGGALELPLLWRPKVRLGARLYYLKTGKSKAKVNVTQSVGWGEYLATLLHWKVYLGLSSPSTRQRLEQLLDLAALQLKARIENAV